MAFSEFSGYIPRCQHIKTNGIQCGCPALHRKRFCYFHNRWRAASINLKRAARSAGMLELPVLEDANSIQVALMQVMRLILTRQLDHKTAGLILYALQTASTNLRQVDFDPRHKTDVVIDPRSVAETSVGEDAWAVEDFEEEEEAEDADPAACVARTPSSAEEAISCGSREPSLLLTSGTPASVSATRESTAAADPAPTPIQPDQKELRRIQNALRGAERGNMRDLKTILEFAGVYPHVA